MVKYELKSDLLLNRLLFFDLFIAWRLHKSHKGCLIYLQKKSLPKKKQTSFVYLWSTCTVWVFRIS